MPKFSVVVEEAGHRYPLETKVHSFDTIDEAATKAIAEAFRIVLEQPIEAWLYLYETTPTGTRRLARWCYFASKAKTGAEEVGDLARMLALRCNALLQR